MAFTKKYIALDIGGSGGRCVIGKFDGESLVIEKLHEFDNHYVRVLDEYYWDILQLFSGIKQSLKITKNTYGSDISSMGIDTMGVNFALLDKSGSLLSNPYYTRILQKKEILDEAFSLVSKKEIYKTTGLQLTKLNSLYHFVDMVKNDSAILHSAKKFLMLPDLLNYWLSGECVSEYTMASTSHMLNASTKKWAFNMVRKIGIPTGIFPEIIQPGNVIGKLHSSVNDDIGINNLKISASASHDTAAALSCVLPQSNNYAYLSSGTWGMIGCDIEKPILTEKSCRYNFANEGAVNGKIRYLYNSVNLWLLKECKRIWALNGKDYSWGEMISMAQNTQKFYAYIDPQWPEFLVPKNMPKAICEMCKKTHQKVPQSDGQIIRVIIESLALKYKYNFDRMSDILNRTPEIFHIVGGGGQNKLLNQFTANALNVPVIIGPHDATAAGNIIMQMIAVGDLKSITEGKELLVKSFGIEEYIPCDTDIWHNEYHKFLRATKL